MNESNHVEFGADLSRIIEEELDLRRPDLWEQYIDYLKEYYRIRDEKAGLKGGSPFDPPQYKRC